MGDGHNGGKEGPFVTSSSNVPGDPSNDLRYSTDVFLHEWDRRKYIDNKLASLAALAGALLSVTVLSLSLQGLPLPLDLTVWPLLIATILFASCSISVLIIYFRTWSIAFMPLKGTNSESIERALRRTTTINRGINTKKARLIRYPYAFLILGFGFLATALVMLLAPSPMA